MGTMSSWAVVFRSSSRQEAEIVRGALEADDIAAVVMDTGPSVYPQLGDCEVHVHRDDVVRALYLVRKHQQP